MDGRMYKRLIHFSLVILLCGAGSAGVQAANTAPSDINMNDLNILEHRYFSHAYGHDPSEKRLERLECLVFGSARQGTNAERLDRLTKTVAARSQQPLAQEKAPPPEAAVVETPKAAAKLSNSSRQYPVLNTLEWKALKKTYANETLDQRLDRLESKMFGQPAQGMAYIDRVERLKKTVGIGLTEAPDGITARGPMPKALPRGSEFDTGGAMPLPLQGFMPPAMNPFPGGMDPFGDTAFDGMRQMRQMLQNFQNMDKQMSDMKNSGVSRTWTFDPEKNEWVEQSVKKKLGPGPVPREKPKVTLPGDGGHIKDIPGYADPNSI